jgi:HAD superfamily hydrolase (TIGR01490 family)
MDFIRAVFFSGSLFLSFAFGYPIVLVASFFIPKPERKFFWTKMGAGMVRVICKMVGIRIKLVGQLPTLDSPILVAGNHASALDGFLINDLFKGRLYALTAPFRDFPFPFPPWFARGACIPVQRDWHDELLYPEVGKRRGVIQTLVGLLKEGNSVLIFPEGHYERTGELHYFHTGVARLSIASSTPVCPFTISGLDKILIGSMALHPGTATITFGQKIHPPYDVGVNSKEAVLQFRDKIQNTVIKSLPLRNIPSYLKEKQQDKIAAFFDIDRTLYLGYSQQDFLKYLLEHHVVPFSELVKTFEWILEEKIGMLEHQELMNRAYEVFNGWDMERLTKTCKQFFDERVPHKLFDKMTPYIKDHQEQGHATVLVTEVVEPLGKYFREFFETTDIIATRMCQKKGLCTGSVKVIMCGKEKAKAAKQWAEKHGIDLSKSYAYADSPSDFYLLHEVGFPTAVRPKHALLVEAQKRNWKILE